MKIIFFTGKGGVGKSSLSAAAAWQLSQTHRVLLVSLDPAHNLGDIFGVPLRTATVRFTDRLFLKEIDLKGLAREYLQREISVFSNSYAYLQSLNLDTCFSVLQYSPGIEEYALLTGIEATLHKKDFDYVIFDTPPTGLTLRFLALPSITITWIERLIALRRKILDKRYTIRRIRGAGSAGETTLAYNELKDDVLNRLQSLEHNYRQLNATLQGSECSIVLVFNPDTLSLKESERLIQGIEDLRLPLRRLIHNKVQDDMSNVAARIEKSILLKAGAIPVTRIGFTRSFLDDENRKLYDVGVDLTSLF